MLLNGNLNRMMNLSLSMAIRKVKDSFAFTFLRREISPATSWQLYTAFVCSVKVEKKSVRVEKIIPIFSTFAPV